MDNDRGCAAGGDASRPGAAPLRFRVEGLDCQNEVRALKGAVGPLVGGEDGLSFDTRAGLMSVAAPGGASVEAIARAVAGTGMRAELLDDVAPAPEARPATAEREPLVFQVMGLDCQNEVAALRRAVGPLVGGEERLFFDTAKGLMTVVPSSPVSASAITEAVARTGMRATARVSGAGGPHQLFRVRGLDCKNEVALLERGVGPLVGGARALAFDTGRGAMTVVGGPRSAPPDEIRQAVRLTGMDAEPWREEAPSGAGTAASVARVFRVEGLDCQNEVAALKREVGPVVGGADRLLFDTAKGVMAIAPGSPTGDVEGAVRRTGMRAMPVDGGPGAGPARLFRVTGLDCKNEAAALTRELGPLVGGAEVLAFDTGRGAMIVAPGPQPTSAMAIQEAVARTGMRAEPWPEGDAAPGVGATDACGMGCGGNIAAALAPPLPTHAPDAVVFHVHGLDCGDEVAALKREVGPVVGGEERLAFDLLNGRMAVTGEVSPELADRIEKAVARTGMRAEPWQEGEHTAAAAAEERRRRVQTVLTAASGILAALGVALHAWLGGGLAAALGAEEGGGGTPLPARRRRGPGGPHGRGDGGGTRGRSVHWAYLNVQTPIAAFLQEG